MERLVLMTPGERITVEDLPDSVRIGEVRPGPSGSTLEEARRGFEREWLLAKLARARLERVAHRRGGRTRAREPLAQDPRAEDRDEA